MLYSPAEIQQQTASHHQVLLPYVEPFKQRRANQQTHPVEDFLFTYYSHRPAALLRWHPGLGNQLQVTSEFEPEQSHWKYYRHHGDVIEVDLEAFVAKQLTNLRFHYQLLQRTQQRRAKFGCFGLHEWAMAYRAEKHGIRHSTVPLRLGAAATNEVVETHNIQCSHYDAFRFFAPEAVNLNTLNPSRETQLEWEQPGCLHANMDLYRVAYKLTPLIPGNLVRDCFLLAWDIRTVDMQASPYDLSDFGYKPIKIETAEGKTAYVQRQQEFSARAEQLRRELLSVLEKIPADLNTNYLASSNTI